MQTSHEKQRLDEYMSVSQGAARLKLTPMRVRQLCDSGALLCIRVGPGWRLIDAEALEQFARAREASEARNESH